MTSNLRKTLIGSLSILSIISFMASCAVVVLWFRRELPARQADWLRTVGGITFLSSFPFFSELFLRKLFGRSNSSEIFFMRFLLLSLSIQAVRFLILAVDVNYLPYWWGTMATRVAWFGRLQVINSALGIAIFSGDISFRKSGYYLGISTLISIMIAIMLPVDNTQITANLMMRIGSEKAMALICIFAQILAVTGLVANAYLRRIPRYYTLAVYLLLLLFGSDLSFFVSEPLILLGAVSLVFGVLGFAYEIRRIYQWI